MASIRSAHGLRAASDAIGAAGSLPARALAKGRLRSTRDHYVFALERPYRWAELPAPLATENGRLLLRALGEPELRQILALLIDDTADVRDHAPLVVAYETLMGHSDLAGMVVDWLEMKADGTGSVLLAISKTDHQSKGKCLPISAEAVELLQAWMRLASIESGPVWGTIPLSLLGKAYEAPMSGAAIAQVFNKRAKKAGFDPALFGGHSTRIGAAEDLVAAGATELKVMQAGRWKTPTMVARYTEHLRDAENAMMVLRKTKGRFSKG